MEVFNPSTQKANLRSTQKKKNLQARELIQTLGQKKKKFKYYLNVHWYRINKISIYLHSKMIYNCNKERGYYILLQNILYIVLLPLIGQKKISVVTYACNRSTWEAETRGSVANQGTIWLHNKAEPSLEYKRSWPKTQKQN